MAWSATTSVSPSRQTTLSGPIARSEPGSACAGAPSRTTNPFPPPGSCQATDVAAALGSVPLSVSTLDVAALAGTPPSTSASAAALSASAPTARIARRTRGRSAIAAARSTPRAVSCSGASTTTGTIRPAANATPTASPIALSPSATQAAASA